MTSLQTIVPVERAIPMGCLLIALATAGCARAPASVEAAKPPRPVSTILLRESSPSVPAEVTGSVASWKTERLAFEVDGRVEQVIEANEEVEARVVSNDGEAALLAPGTPLARLDAGRFRIAVEADRAAVEVARRQLDAARVDLERRLPARIEAAKAEQQLARLEFERSRRLTQQSVGTRSELDQAETRLATASANLAATEAELASRAAELRSLEAQARQAEQRLADSERDLADAVLYSPFRGQVAQTHVTPGAFVRAGDPIATVQMMDPVAVEFEVSAEDSRRFRRWDTLSVLAEGRDGPPRRLDGVVYRTSAVADPETRTFTVTLLVRNPQEREEGPAAPADSTIAQASFVMPLNIGPMVGGASGVFADEASILRDDAGAFLWRVTNRRMGASSIGDGGLLRVEKLRIEAEGASVPFLGDWKFVPIRVLEGQEVDPERDLIVGDLTVDEGDADSWDGDTVRLVQPRWLLRPGDVVRVDLGGESSPKGFYVPMRALRRDSGRTFVFVAEEGVRDHAVATRVEVALSDGGGTFLGTSTLHRVEPVDHDAPLAEGARLVVEGAHYLADGDAITEIRHGSGGRW